MPIGNYGKTKMKCGYCMSTMGTIGCTNPQCPSKQTHSYSDGAANFTTQLDRIEAKLDTLLAKKKPKPRSSKKHEYSAKFELIWLDYPNTKGSNKQIAYTAYQKRLRETDKPLQLMVNIHFAVIKYAAYLEATGRYAKLPETFFGPSKHYENDWTIPKKKHSEDPDRQHHPTYDPKAEVIIPAGVNPYQEDMT